MGDRLLALGYSGASRPRDAVSLLKHIVAVRSRSTPADDAGGLQAGLVLEPLAVAMDRALPQDSLARYTTKCHLMNAYLQTRRDPEAIITIRCVFATGGAPIPEGHPSKLDLQAQLGQVLLRTGQVWEAIALLEHVRAEESRAEDDSSRSYSKIQLARAYAIDGRLQDVRPIVERITANEFFMRTIADECANEVCESLAYMR